MKIEKTNDFKCTLHIKSNEHKRVEMGFEYLDIVKCFQQGEILFTVKNIMYS